MLDPPLWLVVVGDGGDGAESEPEISIWDPSGIGAGAERALLRGVLVDYVIYWWNCWCRVVVGGVIIDRGDRGFLVPRCWLARIGAGCFDEFLRSINGWTCSCVWARSNSLDQLVRTSSPSPPPQPHPKERHSTHRAPDHSTIRIESGIRNATATLSVRLIHRSLRQICPFAIRLSIESIRYL
jgi:hypothetical protein